MTTHPIPAAIESAIKSLPYGATKSHSHTTRGHVWAPQDAVFVEADVEFHDGQTLVFTEEGERVGYVLKAPDGAVLDQGTVPGPEAAAAMVTAGATRTACFVCGRGPHAPAAGHDYFSTGDADAWYGTQPTGAYSPEAAYVSQHRPV